MQTPAVDTSVKSLRATLGLSKALAVDLAIVVGCLMPAAVIPLLSPPLAIVLVLGALAVFLWSAARGSRDAEAAPGVVSMRWLRAPQAILIWPAAVMVGVMDLLLQAWYYRWMPAHEHAVTALDRYEQQPYGAIVIALFVIAYAPVVEEFVFRRRMLAQLRVRFGNAAAIAVAAVLFAGLHFSLWSTPFTLMSGIILGIAAVSTGSIWAPVLLHSATNAAPSLLALALSSDIRVDRWLDATGIPRGGQAAMTLGIVAATIGLLWTLFRHEPAARGVD